jgi:hypothetical protein
MLVWSTQGHNAEMTVVTWNPSANNSLKENVEYLTEKYHHSTLGYCLTILKQPVNPRQIYQMAFSSQNSIGNLNEVKDIWYNTIPP